MILKETVGDIFSSGCDVICHQVNCQGVMGIGIAKAIRNRWPIAFEQYSEFLKNNTIVENGVKVNTKEFLGLCQIVKIDNKKYIANLFGQDTYGNDSSVVYTDYNALKIALMNLKRLILFGNYGITSIAIPFNLGCGFANGDWNIIYGIICEVFKDIDNLLIEIRRLEN